MNADEDLLDVVHDEIYNAALRFGLGRDKAGDFAMMVEAGMRNRCGGRRHYLPVPGCRKTKSEQIIKALSAGQSVQSIVRRYKVSRQRVYQLRREIEV